MPLEQTSPVIYKGVSEENVVATIDIPASHQGAFLPERKNSAIFLDALLVK